MRLEHVDRGGAGAVMLALVLTAAARARRRDPVTGRAGCRYAPVALTLLLILGACSDDGTTRSDAGAGSAAPASAPPEETESETIVEEALGATAEDVHVLASLRVDGGLFALVENDGAGEVRWSAIALSVKGDQVDVADVVAEAGPGQPVFPQLPERGSGDTYLTSLDAAGVTVSAGFVDPEVTRIDAVKDGARVGTSAPTDAGATIFRIAPWAQVRMYQQERLAGATLAAGRLAPVSGKVGKPAVEAAEDFIAAAHAGDRLWPRFFASGVPRHVATDLVDALREADVDLSKQSEAELGPGGVTITFGEADVATELDLYVSRDQGRWRIYQYSLGAGFGGG